MSMKATTREVNGVTILDLSGRITLGQESGTVRDEVLLILASGSKKILVNLKDVTYIDSSGLGEFGGRVYRGEECRRRAEAVEPDEQSSRSAGGLRSW